MNGRKENAGAPRDRRFGKIAERVSPDQIAEVLRTVRVMGSLPSPVHLGEQFVGKTGNLDRTGHRCPLSIMRSIAFKESAG